MFVCDTTSIISFVMRACRCLLYVDCKRAMTSRALSVAACIAAKREDCSEAIDSRTIRCICEVTYIGIIAFKTSKASWSEILYMEGGVKPIDSERGAGFVDKRPFWDVSWKISSPIVSTPVGVTGRSVRELGVLARRLTNLVYTTSTRSMPPAMKWDRSMLLRLEDVMRASEALPSGAK